MTPVDELVVLYESPAAQRRYDEAVTEREHALQSAALATAAGEDDAMVVAALLHDIGHLIVGDLATIEVALTSDAEHEAVGARWLRRWFGPEVTAPVALHVAAKRYLCGADESYVARLSPSSVRSLGVQGGPMPAIERADFERRAGARAALRLRRYDDDAKVAGLEVPSFDAYLGRIEHLRR